MKIVVLDGYCLNPGDNPWDVIEALSDGPDNFDVFDDTDEDPAAVVARCRHADIVLTNKVPLSRETIEQLPRLQLISVLATGYNMVDVDAASRAGVVVSNVPEYGTDSVAQAAFALLLEILHATRDHDAAVRSGKWAAQGQFSMTLKPLIELAGLTLGIVGMGRIGRRVGEIADAFGMTVIAFNRSRRPKPPLRDFRWCEQVEELFESADVVSLNCPLTDENERFVNRRLLAKMKPTAVLLNVSRGQLIDEADLANALNSGAIAAAGLDVVSAEPICPTNPLLKARNCLITPHNAWATTAARRRMMQTTADNIAAMIAGRPINVVNEHSL